MLYRSKFDRAREVQRRARGLDREEVPPEEDLGPIEKPGMDEEMEKGDLFSMMTAGCLTVFIPASLILVGIVILAMALFGVFR